MFIASLYVMLLAKVTCTVSVNKKLTFPFRAVPFERRARTVQLFPFSAFLRACVRTVPYTYVPRRTSVWVAQ